MYVQILIYIIYKKVDIRINIYKSWYIAYILNNWYIKE